MKIVFAGAGRLATNFALALSQAGHQIAAVYSRTMASAEGLARLVGSEATDDIGSLPHEADAFIISVKDDALASVAGRLAVGRQNQVFLHTSGAVPMAAVGTVGHHGVIYPLQTFSKKRQVDFSRVPFFIEGSDAVAQEAARSIATSLSSRVQVLASADRRRLHLAAVFACNFSNHCYALAAEVLGKCGLTFDVLLPLIDETTAKVHHMSPRDAQTGPAVRYDENVIRAHEQLLADDPQLQAVYSELSRSIHQLYQRQ